MAFLISFAVALLVVVPPAFACSCATDVPSSPESMRQAIELHEGGIFVGTVTSAGHVHGRHVVTIQVEQVIKGEFGPIVNIDTTDPFAQLCGSWRPALGSRFGLFVHGSPTSGWKAGSCVLEVEPGHLLANAPSSRPPDPSIEPLGPIAPGRGSIIPWVTIAAITALLVGGARFLLAGGDGRPVVTRTADRRG